MTTYPEFADLINRYLGERERSLTWLAQRLGISHSTVSRWLNQETRPADPETVIRIADILGVHDSEDRQGLLIAAGYGYLETNARDVPPAETNAVAPEAVDHINRSSTGYGREDDRRSILSPYMTPALPPQGVLGRNAMLAHLHKMLGLDTMDVVDMPPIALHGMGGIGKTTLAIALGRQTIIPRLFPDGVLWTTVGPSPTIRNLLDDWGRAIGENLLGERDVAACHARLRSVLYGKRMLLIVDDVWDAEHGRPFLVAGPYCRTLITTRESPAAYGLTTRERTLAVDVLSPEAALQLLSRLTPDIVLSNVSGAQSLCARLEYLPLALTLAGRMLAQESDVPSRMERLLGELIERREARLKLTRIEGRPGLDPEKPASLYAILGLSVERLSRVEQERFALLSAFGGEPLTWELGAATYLWKCSEEEAELTISHFIQRGLVMQRDGQYWMHALLADYSAEMLEGYG